MKIVVMGGAGRVGAQLVRFLGARDGIQVIACSRRTGVDLVTGEGLEAAVDGAQAVVDVANAPSYDGPAAQAFFDTATRNLLNAESAGGVIHHIGLSVVGAERLQASGYFRAKLAQEHLVQTAGIPCTILRSTQFFELLPEIVQAASAGDAVRLPPARVQFVAARDVAAALADLALQQPLGDAIEVAGPDASRLDALARDYMAAVQDRRPVLADPEALYFGSRLGDETLMAGDVIRFCHTDFAAWLRQAQPHPAAA